MRLRNPQRHLNSFQPNQETPSDLGVSCCKGYLHCVVRKLPESLADRIRFPETANQNRTQCWVWTGMTRLGTGYARVDGRQMTARRAVYLHLRGEPGAPLRPGVCEIDSCVNPWHQTTGGPGRRAV